MMPAKKKDTDATSAYKTLRFSIAEVDAGLEELEQAGEELEKAVKKISSQPPPPAEPIDALEDADD